MNESDAENTPSHTKHSGKSHQTPQKVMPNTSLSHLTPNGARARIERNEHAHRTKRARAPFGVSQLTMAFGITFHDVWPDLPQHLP